MRKIKWVIVGQRRWARLIANELCMLLGPHETVSLYSEDNDASIVCWYKNNEYRGQLKIITNLGPCSPHDIGIAIIANSAYMHYNSINLALNNGYNIIAEKPLTLSKEESVSTINKCSQLGLRLFTTNTFLFADYFTEFKKRYLCNRKIKRISFNWTDPVAEIRYGEIKKYDSSIPIFYDVLPHIASILIATYGDLKISHSNIRVFKGGSYILLRYRCSDTLVNVRMARNHETRIRTAHFLGDHLDKTIDFSSEPGQVISTNDQPQTINILKCNKKKPIAQMLSSAKQYFENGILDHRLNSVPQLLANTMIDAVANQYIEHQLNYIQQLNNNKDLVETYAGYAMKEVNSLYHRSLTHLEKNSVLLKLANNKIC